MKRTTFFLVDDDRDDRYIFEEILYEINPSIRFQSAEDGRAAIIKLRALNPELPAIIFLDLNMPVMNGKECLKQLKADSLLRNVPVIMYSTSSLSRDIEEAMLNGAVCFITKPSRTIDLKRVLLTISSSLPDNLFNGIRQLTDDKSLFVIS